MTPLSPGDPIYLRDLFDRERIVVLRRGENQADSVYRIWWLSQHVFQIHYELRQGDARYTYSCAPRARARDLDWQKLLESGRFSVVDHLPPGLRHWPVVDVQWEEVDADALQLYATDIQAGCVRVYSTTYDHGGHEMLIRNPRLGGELSIFRISVTADGARRYLSGELPRTPARRDTLDHVMRRRGTGSFGLTPMARLIDLVPEVVRYHRGAA